MKVQLNADLTNKISVVTGGGGVLCSMFAKTLAACGSMVAVLDLNEDAAKAVADEITSNGGKAKGYKADVLSTDSLNKVRNQIEKDFGTCDILINGAGGNNPNGTTSKEYFNLNDLEAKEEIKTFFDLDPQGVQFVFNLNFLGTFLTTQVFAKDMAKKQSGNIINISSMNAFTPLTKIPAYSGAKAAISNFTQWLAVHFSKVGIRVNAIAPGFFVTKQNEKLLFNEDGTPTPRTDKIISATPMERFGKPEELLGTFLFLINDDAASFVDGVIIPVDGGFSAYSGV